MTESVEVAIIGAGMAGLACADALAHAGMTLRGFEAAETPGGRLASLPLSPHHPDLRFDAGAQYATAHRDDFRALLERSVAAGHADLWEPRALTEDTDGTLLPAPGKTRWVGSPTMPDLTRLLFVEAHWTLGVCIGQLARDGDAWLLRDEEGASRIRAQRVVIALPPKAAFSLLPLTSPLRQLASSVTMHPEVSLGLKLERAMNLPAEAYYLKTGPLAWAARDASKPGRPEAEVWSLRASTAWSRARADSSSAEIEVALIAAFRRLVGRPLPRIEAARVVSWEESLPSPALSERALQDAERGIILAGDWCGGPRVEGAFASGRAAAALLNA